MNESAEDPVERAARTYGAAADHWQCPALSFWDRFGAQTVDRLRLRPGAHVADLCCGAGASAIPAAHAVGPSGHVTGIDVAEPLLAHARRRAAAEGLSNVEFRLTDATHSGLATQSMDAVVCVFGLFFAADMPGFAAELWRLVRPGGVLAVTTWGRGLWEPATSLFWSAVGAEAPDLVRKFNPWDEITTPGQLTALLTEAGITGVTADAVAGRHELADAQSFWDVALGSGYRATLDALEPAQQARVRRSVIGELAAQGVTTLRTDVVYAVARRA